MSYAYEYACLNGIPFIDCTPKEPLEDLNVVLAETPSRWYFDVSNDTYFDDAVIYIGIYDSENRLLTVEMTDMIKNDITSIPIKKVNNYSYAKIFEWVDMKAVTQTKLLLLR